MRNFSIDIIWAKIQMAVAAIGGWLGYFLGGMDGLMIALIIFMVLDYVTGLMCAVIDKKLSSAVGFKGICKKVLILMLVGVANERGGHSHCGHRLSPAQRRDLLLPVQRGSVLSGERGPHRTAHSR